MPLLSILICSLTRRGPQLASLLASIGTHPDMEVLTDVDDGAVTVGTKRNQLLDAAGGEYAVFVDDDDELAPHYTERIVAACREGKDCVGMVGTMLEKGSVRGQMYHSITVGKWEWKGGIAYRYPNHINPVRREHALATRFREMDAGEDGDYSHRLRPLLATEAWAGHDPLYIYHHSPFLSTTETRTEKIAYRNRFAGDFTLSCPVRRVGRNLGMDVQINGATLKATAAGKNQTEFLCVQRIGDIVTVRFGDASADVPCEYPTCRVVLPLSGTARLVGQPHLIVGGHEILQ